MKRKRPEEEYRPKKTKRTKSQQLRFNPCLRKVLGLKYCSSDQLPTVMKDTGLCKRPEKKDGTKVELRHDLQTALSCDPLIEPEQLLALMITRGLCMEVWTFVVTVWRMDGVEYKVVLDEDTRCLDDMRTEMERISGIPRHTLELYMLPYYASEEHNLEESLPEDFMFTDECTLVLFINTEKPCRPNFVAVLFSVLRKKLEGQKYKDLQQIVETLKEGNSISINRATSLRTQILEAVGRATMRQAMEEAKKEMRERNERLDKYEPLLLYILDGGSHEDSKVPEEDRLCCENLAILLEHYRTHRWIEGYAYLEDERVTSMITILEGSKSMRVRELLYAPTPTPTGEPIGSPS